MHLTREETGLPGTFLGSARTPGAFGTMLRRGPTGPLVGRMPGMVAKYRTWPPSRGDASAPPEYWVDGKKDKITEGFEPFAWLSCSVCISPISGTYEPVHISSPILGGIREGPEQEGLEGAVATS